MGKGWRSLEGPSGGAPADGKALNGVTVYYEFRDSAGEMHVVDSKELIPKDAKGLHKVYLRNAPSEPPPAVDVPIFHQAQTMSQDMLGSMASTLGVAPPPPAKSYIAAPVTASTALVPSIPVLRPESFSPSVFAPIAGLLVLGLIPRLTRRVCIRILSTGLSMMLLGTLYMNWAKAHGYRRLGPGNPIADVVNVADTVNAHSAEQQRILDAIDRK